MPNFVPCSSFGIALLINACTRVPERAPLDTSTNAAPTGDTASATAVLPRSGQLARALDARARTVVVGPKGDTLRFEAVIRNRGDSVVLVEGSGCRLMPRAFRDAGRASPFWLLERAHPAGVMSGCTMGLWQVSLAPGDSAAIRAVTVPVHRFRGDSVPPGRYYFGVELRLNDERLAVPAGTVVVEGEP
jgi:hypothetical protein